MEIVVIDNGSDTPYPIDWAAHREYWGVKVTTIRNERNLGFYLPLLQIASQATNADIVGLLHNDLFIYEQGWDRRLMDSFLRNPRLGMVGVCGSGEVDDRGGRGGGTMCNFAGSVGQLQEHTGRKTMDLERALVLDSMFIALRRPLVDTLKIDHHIAPCHFYDKIWPLRIIEAGWHVAVLGLLVDHQGGLTSTGTRFEKDCEDWCKQENLAYDPGKANLSVYLEAERRFLTEFRSKGMIPSYISPTWPRLAQ